MDTTDRINAGSPFNASPDLQYLLDETRVYVAGDAPIEYGGAYVPRYGILSLLSRDTPGYVYTHPALAAICHTAFTDGIHAFFYGPFLQSLFQSERDHPGCLERVPIWCHELMHKLLEHHRRLRNFPTSIANDATDCSINPRLALMFRERQQKYGPIFAQGQGMASQAEMERYCKLSEEQIARELLEQCQTHFEKSALARNVESKTSANTHTIALEHLAQILETHPDITYVKDVLRLPDSSHRQAIRELEQQASASTLQKMNEVKRLLQRYGDRYPAREVDSYAVEILEELSEPKIKWTASIADLLAGRGTPMTYTDDHPSKIFFVDPADMGLVNEVYLGSYIPAEPDGMVLSIIDTSGSVDKDMLVRYFSEVLGCLERSCGIGAVLVCHADTMVRGAPLRITRDNAAEFLRRIEVRGRRGTDFITPILQAWSHPHIRQDRHRVRALLYFTDLGATPPQRAQLPANLPPMAFVTLPGCLNPGFANAVRSYARVIEIDQHTVVDLDRLSTPAAAPGNRRHWRARRMPIP
jgi:predicted metal-dependent peptidase